MFPRIKEITMSKSFMPVTLGFCALMVILLVITSWLHSDNKLDSFSEPVISVSQSWTLVDSSGNLQSVEFPQTITYGTDGRYTLTGTFQRDEELIASPALCFYSNYVNFSFWMDGKEIYKFPEAGIENTQPTGNTYHFIRLPSDYAEKEISVILQCQLGSSISYLLKEPQMGSKATMLRASIFESILSIILAGCMLALAISLAILHISFRKRLKLNSATSCTALFALLFAVYVFCETSFAQFVIQNGYGVFCCTLMLLAMLPIPLMGLFLDDVSRKYRRVMEGLLLMCALNLFVQMLLNICEVASLRAMLPATHIVIIVVIITAVCCLLKSDKKEKPFARRKLLTAVPMIVGGITDIILIIIKHPSFNNSFWFTLGVTAFIILQFAGFVRSFFFMYRTLLETELLRDMAYRDALTEIGNRNAYERKLTELSTAGPMGGLSCLVLDINDLKIINDTLGHKAGDIAISEIGKLLSEMMPESATSYRTGGDEFVVILENFDDQNIKELVENLIKSADIRGRQYDIPISIAVGYGSYKQEDGNIIDFINRVDTMMYQQKQIQKNE